MNLYLKNETDIPIKVKLNGCDEAFILDVNEEKELTAGRFTEIYAEHFFELPKNIVLRMLTYLLGGFMNLFMQNELIDKTYFVYQLKCKIGIKKMQEDQRVELKFIKSNMYNTEFIIVQNKQQPDCEIINQPYYCEEAMKQQWNFWKIELLSIDVLGSSLFVILLVYAMAGNAGIGVILFLLFLVVMIQGVLAHVYYEQKKIWKNIQQDIPENNIG